MHTERLRSRVLKICAVFVLLVLSGELALLPVLLAFPSRLLW